MPSFQGCNFKREIGDGSYIEYDVVIHVTAPDLDRLGLNVEYYYKYYNAANDEYGSGVIRNSAVIEDDGGSDDGGGDENN